MPQANPTPPDRQTITHVVTRAAEVRRQRYQGDPRYQHYTADALLEQVCGQEGVPMALDRGWWHVGTLADRIAGVELDVLTHPDQRRILIREPAPPPEQAPPPPTQPPRPATPRVPVSEGERRYREWLQGKTRDSTEGDDGRGTTRGRTGLR